MLYLDNCSAHEPTQDLPELKFSQVHFLPPNTTSRIQPMDAVIIAALKALYRRRLLFRIFENMDAGAKIVYNVGILTAMQWVSDDWENMSLNRI